ncbi:MAG: hypothetical protein H5U00_05490 [Clostridia bacterium]|nr:hypothetical protein [Clostridia bacterium]
MLAYYAREFPYSFRNTKENRRYLPRLKELLPGVPLVVEFRNRGRAREPVWELTGFEKAGAWPANHGGRISPH